MGEGSVDLLGFAYGEDLEPGSGRSLGYRLLAPLGADWSGEVEALARRLQAAPYPDTWPAVDLFCSVLLGDGRRLVARARYGLSDHTAARRRGGLELIGVLAPAGLGVQPALALYRWLGQRRAGEDDMHRLGGTFHLADVLAAAPAEETVRPEGLVGPVPVLPVRLWQDGVLLFAAAAPAEPDHHLRLLEQAGTAHWQWLPLAGPDFPFATFAQRGPLVAWTPHLAGVAVRLDRGQAIPTILPSRRARRGRYLASFLTLIIVALLAGNLWYMRQVHRDLAAIPTTAPSPPPAREERPPPAATTEDARERFARALYRVLGERGADREMKDDRAALLERYNALVRRYPDLAVGPDNDSGKLAIAATAVLAGRGADRIEEMVSKALAGKGFSDKLIQAARDHIRDQFAAEVRER
jgi:hypothetical protein